MEEGKGEEGKGAVLVQLKFKITMVAGHALKWDEIIYNGSVDERKFVAFYVK